MKKLALKKQMKCLIGVMGILLWAASPAFGQISYTMTDKHERLKRQALREASQTDTNAFADTHLNMNAYTFKKGEVGKAERRPLLRMFRPTREAVQRTPAEGDKKRFRLFRKKDK